MSTESLISQLRLITGTTFVLGLITLLLVLVAFRRSRRESFWRMRRDAGRRGVRYFAVAMILLSVSAAFCLVTVTVTYVEDRDEDQTADLPSPTATPTETPTNPIEATPNPLQTATPLSPTQTLQPTFETTLTVIPQVPNPSPETPAIPTNQEIAAAAPIPPTAAITTAVMIIQALDDVIGDDLKAIQPADSFNTATQRLYIFFTYQGMEPGMIWGQTLLKDGQIVQQHTQKWGIAEKSGETFFFFGNAGGFEAGVYEIRLTAGEAGTLLAAMTFTILPEG